MKGSWVLSRQEKAEIARLYKAGKPLSRIAARYRVSEPAVIGIARRRGASLRQEQGERG